MGAYYSELNRTVTKYPEIKKFIGCISGQNLIKY